MDAYISFRPLSPVGEPHSRLKTLIRKGQKRWSSCGNARKWNNMRKWAAQIRREI